MKRSLQRAVGCLVAGLIIPSAFGQMVVFTGEGGPIPDATVDGFGQDVPTTTTFDISIIFPIPLSTTPITALEVELAGLYHGRSGDLTISVMDVGLGISVVLVDRLGYPEVGPFGSTFPFEGSYTFSDFVNEFPPVDAPLDPAFYLPEQPLIPFSGKTPQGHWILTITDHASGHAGVLDRWALRMTMSPTPGSLILLALAPLVARRRR